MIEQVIASITDSILLYFRDNTFFGITATQDSGLVLGVGYGCFQYNLPKKKKQEVIAPARDALVV